jgi:ubiquitin C-terminal hydrolase
VPAASAVVLAELPAPPTDLNSSRSMTERAVNVAPEERIEISRNLNNASTNKVCGLKNPGSMCYLNTAIQLLLDIPEISDYFSKKKIDEPIKYTISPQCKTMPTETDKREYNKNIKLLQHIFNTINTDSAKNPKTQTDIIKIKTPGSEQTETPTTENTAYYELAKKHGDAFLNDQDRLKQEVLQNIHLYQGLTPENVDKYIEDEIAPLERKYNQADPGEFLSTLFFPNFLCVDEANNFTKIIGVMESSEITCKNDKKYNTTTIYSPIITLYTDDTNKSISALLEKYKEIEEIEGVSEQCKTDTDTNENQKTKQIKHTLQRDPETKYIILYLNRTSYNTKIEIDKEITINGVNYRRKGCIFHTGNTGGGHYVYGSYDKDGKPNHVRDDAEIISVREPGIAGRVFIQFRYHATVCLYERVEPQTQLIKAGSTKTKKRKHKNKKRKTQHKARN